MEFLQWVFIFCLVAVTIAHGYLLRELSGLAKTTSRVTRRMMRKFWPLEYTSDVDTTDTGGSDG